MLEAKDIGLLVVEQISRLRRLEDETFREKKMLQYAQDYSGDKPNLEKLHDEINKELSFEKDRKTRDDQKIKEYVKQEKQRKKELQEVLDETTKWCNNQFELELKSDMDQVETILKDLQERSSTLVTDKEFNALVRKQIEFEDRVKNLEINLNMIRKRHLSTCPFCGGFVSGSKMKSMIKNLNDNIDSLKGQQSNISVVKQEIEEYREKLRKAYLNWEAVCELIKKENGGNDDENNSSISD